MRLALDVFCSLTLLGLILEVVDGTPLAPLSTYKRTLPFLGGVNLAGCEFGTDTNGNVGTPDCPGTAQIAHFVADGVNLFRLPVAWQYLVGNEQSSTYLDPSFFPTYDGLVRAILAAGRYVMIDVHNYARWNGAIIGQGGPSNDEFASLWFLLAKEYANEDHVIFGLMNEPHDVDTALWANTIQVAIDAIRSAGATIQTIALPGNGWTNPSDWFDGTDSPILAVTDPATGDNSLLVLDAHAYLDYDGSGTHTECTTNNVASLTSLAGYLASVGRRAILSETGGGNTVSCIEELGSELAYVTNRTDVFSGFAVWSAGSFAPYPDYELSIVPIDGQDTDLFTQAVKPYLSG